MKENRITALFGFLLGCFLAWVGLHFGGDDLFIKVVSVILGLICIGLSIYQLPKCFPLSEKKLGTLSDSEVKYLKNRFPDWSELLKKENFTISQYYKMPDRNEHFPYILFDRKTKKMGIASAEEIIFCDLTQIDSQYKIGVKEFLTGNKSQIEFPSGKDYAGATLVSLLTLPFGFTVTPGVKSTPKFEYPCYCIFSFHFKDGSHYEMLAYQSPFRMRVFPDQMKTYESLVIELESEIRIAKKRKMRG